MKVTARHRAIIDWDADARQTIVINQGETGEISEKLAEVHRDAWSDDLPQLDHDRDGRPGGSLPEDTVVAQDSAFTMKHVGGGWYEIDGGGLDEPVKVQGKDEAKARYDELVAEADAADGPPA